MANVDYFLDNINKQIYKYFLTFVPLVIPFLTWSVSSYNAILKQAKKTSVCLMDSFKEDTIYFLTYSNNIAINSKALVCPNQLSGEWDWRFTNNTFTQKNNEENLPTKCPWFSGELLYNDDTVYDMTEWLDKIRFKCDKDSVPPPICLVQAWAVSNMHELGPLANYKIKILDDSMEEKIISLV